MAEDVAIRVAVHDGPTDGSETAQFLQLRDLTVFSPALRGPELLERSGALEGGRGE